MLAIPPETAATSTKSSAIEELEIEKLVLSPARVANTRRWRETCQTEGQQLVEFRRVERELLQVEDLDLDESMLAFEAEDNEPAEQAGRNTNIIHIAHKSGLPKAVNTIDPLLAKNSDSLLLNTFFPRIDSSSMEQLKRLNDTHIATNTPAPIIKDGRIHVKCE